MPRTLYVADGSPCSLAVRLCCRMADIDCEIRTIDLVDKWEQRSDWFMKMNPMHCVPTLDDDGFIMWQSRAILRYLVDSYATNDKLFPRDPKQRALVDRHLEHDGTSLFKVVADYGFPIKYLLNPADPRALKQLEKELMSLNYHPGLVAGHYVTGDTPTIADISMLASLTYLESIDFDMSPYPNVAAWIARCKDILPYAECAKDFETWKVFSKTPEWEELMKTKFIPTRKNIISS